MGFWVNVWKYPSVVKQVLSDVKNITTELELLKNDPHLPEAAQQILNHKKAFHRVSQYALVHGVLNFGIARYWGRKLTPEEVSATLSLCALGPLFDDFFDEKDLTSEQIYQLIQEKTRSELTKKEEIAYAFFLDSVYKNTKDTERFYRYFSDLYQAQWQSKSLLNPELPRSELAAISARKGAVSAWVFRSLIAEPISPEELNMLEQLGYLGQFMDDIFDLYDDHQEGLQTLANDYSGDFTPVYEKFLMEIDALKVLIQKLPFSKNRKMRFQRELMLMVSGGILACQHFLKVQRKYGHLDIQNIPRKELIVDMESKKNHIKMLLLALKYA